MAQVAFSDLTQYVWDIDAAVQSQNNAGRYWDIYYRAIVYKTAGSGYQSAPDSYNSGWVNVHPSGARVWTASGFGYNYTGGNEFYYTQGTFRIYANANGNGSYAADGYMQLVSIGTAYVASGNKEAPRIPTVPPAPTVPTTDQITRTSMRVSFGSNGLGGTTFLRWELQRATNASFTQNVVTVNSPGQLVVTGLDPKTRYYYRARGVNADGNGAWSGVNSALTHDYPDKPAAPVISSVTATTIPVDTTDPANNGSAITERIIQLSTVPTFATVVSTKTTADPTFAAADGVLRNTQYYVRWQVGNTYGASLYSDVVAVKTLGTPPSAPTGYAAFDVASTSAKISTGALADNGGAVPSRVRVKISTTNSDSGLVQTVTQEQWAHVRITGLTKGVQYYASQAAGNDAVGGGWGSYGGWTSFTTKTDVPNSPVIAVTDVTDDTAVVNWVAPTQLNGAVIQNYITRIGTDLAILTDTTQVITGATEISQVLVDLEPATKYYVVTWTVTNKGLGSSSSVVSFTTTGESAGSFLWIKVSGIWKQASVWLKVSGTWKLTEIWYKVAGIWKKL